MRKKIIGVVPSAKLFLNEDPYQDRYEYVNSYIARITEAGGIAQGVLPCNGYIYEEALDNFDAFLITGGLQIHPYHFQIVEHCYRTHKKLLGVCLGLQTIHSFFTVLQEKETRQFEGGLLDLYLQMKKEKYMFVLPVENHWQFNITRTQIDPTKHPIQIQKGTLLHKLFQGTTLNVSSMHRYAANNPSSLLSVSAISQDNSIEALEYEDFILGVQFHPEVDHNYMSLFQFLID